MRTANASPAGLFSLLLPVPGSKFVGSPRGLRLDLDVFGSSASEVSVSVRFVGFLASRSRNISAWLFGSTGSVGGDSDGDSDAGEESPDAVDSELSVGDTVPSTTCSWRCATAEWVL